MVQCTLVLSQDAAVDVCVCVCVCVCVQRFPKFTKSCSHFSKIMPTTQVVQEIMAKIGYSVQGLVAKVKNMKANG